jgi:mono/diheme cytochrome c family protein
MRQLHDHKSHPIGRLFRTTALWLLPAALAVTDSRLIAHKPTTQVTWTTDVAPILQRRCVGCHTTNGFGPIDLTTYEAAKREATAIREAVLERRMPPWPGARGFGDFSNDRSLTPIEIELIASWADGGAPIGPTPADRPRTERRNRSPDLVLTLPADHMVRATSERVELSTGLDGKRWIAGWAFLPDNRSLVEQAVLTADDDAPIGSWTPPEPAVMYPPAVALELPSGSPIRLLLRYRKVVTPQPDRSRVALYFTSKPQQALQHRLLRCGTNAIDRDIEALAVTPRATAAGESIEVVARRPDRSVDPLVVVPRYQPVYPIGYRFRSPIRLSRGSSIVVRSSSGDCDAALAFTLHH